MTAPPQYPWARQSAGFAPLRAAGSVRRTTSIDSHWPEGFGQPWVMTGRARDIVTGGDRGEPRVIGDGGFLLTSSPRREILAIETSPVHPRAQQLVGTRAGGASREALASIMADIRGEPLFQILDDFAGASLVAGWIWSEWNPDWVTAPRPPAALSTAGRGGNMENVCTGFASGATSLAAEGRPDRAGQSRTKVGPLENPEDPLGWHRMPVQEGPQMRRARRLDLRRDGEILRADVGFQDSGANPEGGRTAVHEYRVYAEIDPATMTLLSLQALPLILPYSECPGAAVKAARLVGTPVEALREIVPAALAGTLGCTHLNDVLRSLADVPALAKHIPG